MGDSYRPSRRPKGRGGGASLASRITFESGGGDSYRPNDGQTHHHQSGGQNREFTFTAGGSGPQFPPAGPAGDSRSATRKNKRGRGGSGQGQHHQRSSESTTSQVGGRRNQNGFQRGGRRPWRKQQPHERPLLQDRDDTGSEHILGDTDGTSKFLNVEDLSEDETDMDLDTDDASEEGAISDLGPSRKKARADGNSVPAPVSKWSNPDPYTVLPPPDETTGKKKDVVRLIRKAKNQASEKAASSNAVAANDDFISFNFDDDEPSDEDDEEGEVDEEEPMWAPNPHSNYPVRGSLNEAVPTGPASMLALPAKPPPQKSGAKTHKRKHGEGEGVVIVQEWQANTTMYPAPWVTEYAHLRDDMSKWLHNEIMDFYDFVRPNQHEHNVRLNLIQRIENALGTRHFPSASGHVLCFGSYPAELYLPTADMDLVYVTDRFKDYGEPAFNIEHKRQVADILFSASRKLRSRRVGVDVIVVHKAKVPIVKFVDSITGIKVDLSFENLSGIEAQATYQQWKVDYPDMVYLVALVKQFLAMRGLNDVHTGGLGGFSIICICVSYMQLHPKPENLGNLFLGFLDYYGNKFSLARERIVMAPPGIVEKNKWGIDGREEKDDGLSIQDPNRPDNNISGGSRQVKQIFKAFAYAHRTLQERIELLGTGMEGTSILESLLGGNYSSYDEQRRHLSSVK